MRSALNIVNSVMIAVLVAAAMVAFAEEPRQVQPFNETLLP